MPSVTKTHLFNGSLEDVFSGIKNYSHYKDFITAVNEIEVLDPVQKGSSAQVSYKIKLIKTIHYTLNMFETGLKKISWTLSDSNIMKKNDGYWSFKDLGDNRVEATYHLDVKFKGLVPGSIATKMTETQLPKLFEQMQALIDSQKA